MVDRNIRLLTQRIAEVAKRTAIQQSPLVTGTVLSRNPDGSLNVSTPLGACQRVAPRANVRIGQQIVLGLEPALGTQTSLPSVSVTVDPSALPCPTDVRVGPCVPSIGVGCPDLTTIWLGRFKNVFAAEWDSINPTAPFPGFSGDFKDRRPPDLDPSHLSVRGDRAFNVRSYRRSADYPVTSPGGTPYADEFHFRVSRLFFEFDTTGAIPPGMKVFSGVLQIVLAGNTSTWIKNATDQVLMVVPSTDDGTNSALNFSQVLPHVFGRAHISEIAAAGTDPPSDLVPYEFGFNLQENSDTDRKLDDYINRTGTTRLAIVGENDLRTDWFPIQPSFHTPPTYPADYEIREIVDFVATEANALTRLYLTYGKPITE